MTTLHRRTPSQGDDESVVDVGGGSVGAVMTDRKTPSISVSPQPRMRVNSTPMNPNGTIQNANSHKMPPSAGPYRTAFGPMPDGYPSSPLRSSFANGPGSGHARTRSISTPYSPPLPSPLSFSFPSTSGSQPPPMTTSVSAPDNSRTNEISTSPGHARRHSRIHSRNLSIFFPRPGSLPQNTIAEDGSQELHLNGDIEAPTTTIHSTGSSASARGNSRNAPITPLGANFSFGGRPPSRTPNPPLIGAPPSGSSKRRGHHHKHSLSHNFFSFLEPGEGQVTRGGELHTQPTPNPVSPWTPASASGFPTSPMPVTSTDGRADDSNSDDSEKNSPLGPIALTLGQFFLGAWLWVSGQQIGSLSSTGLGYWIVFDSFGMAIGSILPLWLESVSRTAKNSERMRRPYGNGRVETVFMFAQAVYLMFAAVYICKETVEHILLSTGGQEGHHHHPGDEDSSSGIEFPNLLTFLSLLSVIISALFFENHSSFVNTIGNRLPPLREIIRATTSPSGAFRYALELPSSPLARLLSNPYILSPVVFSSFILVASLFIPSSQQRVYDLGMASIISAVTFKVAYQASIVLGTVLLQTSPRRGLSGGKMEAFLRVMKEVERHPQVLHLPAPHIWQLTPTPAISDNGKGTSGRLIVTLELHVKEDLGDDDVLALTRWAWEKCVGALAGSSSLKSKNIASQVEVTVGIVRG